MKRWGAAAPERGLDPNEWFGTVELLALEDVGMQLVQPFGNINEYFLTFSLLLNDVASREKVRKDLEGGGR